MQCKICSQENSVRIRRFYADDAEEIDLRRCCNCGCEFLSPDPSDGLLAKEYEAYYERRTVEMSRPKLAYFRNLLRSVNIDFSGKEILEVGAGEGDCAFAMKSMWESADYTAIEANKECEPYYVGFDCELRAQSIEDWLTTEENKRYDHILLFDLIEHLRSPKSILQDIVDKKLKENGSIIATFPFVNTLTRKTLGSLWPQYKLEHLFYFSENSISRMADDLDLESLYLHPLSKRLPIDFLLAVGKNFGPKPLQYGVRMTAPLVPRFLRSTELSLPLGEALWMARKKSA